MKRLVYVAVAVSLVACSSSKHSGAAPVTPLPTSAAATTTSAATTTTSAAGSPTGASTPAAASSSATSPVASSPSAAASSPATPPSATPTRTKPAVPDVKAQALALSDLPAGWSAEKVTNDNTGEPACFKKLSKLQNAGGKPLAHVEVQFKGTPDGLPSVDESIDAVRSGIKADFSTAVKALAGCGRISLPAGGATLSGTIAPMSFPKVGDESKAYQVLLSGVVKGVRVTAGIDILLFGVGNEEVTLLYATLGAPAISEFEGATKLALNKIKGTGGGTTT